MDDVDARFHSAARRLGKKKGFYIIGAVCLMMG